MKKKEYEEIYKRILKQNDDECKKAVLSILLDILLRPVIPDFSKAKGIKFIRYSKLSS